MFSSYAVAESIFNNLLALGIVQGDFLEEEIIFLGVDF
jgi:hypothetical protein